MKAYRLSNYTAAQIRSDFEFVHDTYGETFDRYTGTVVHKASQQCFRVKIMKGKSDVRESFYHNYRYCDPKLSAGRAKAVRALQVGGAS